MKKEWDTVELLSHVRHDWLNKIQLIKGNLSLNKVDRVKELIDEIILASRQESKLSNLKLPQFAALLLTYNWGNHHIHLEFEILDGDKEERRTVNEDLLFNWTSTFLDNLNNYVKPFFENHLSITIDTRDSGIGFFFDFRGIIVDREQLEKFLHSDVSFELTVHEISEQELSVELFLPY